MRARLRSMQPGRWLRFALVGGTMAILNLLLLWWLIDRLHWNYLLACFLAFFALNLLGYLANKAYTFRLGGEVVPVELWRYYVVMGISLATNLALMALLVEVAGVRPLLAALVVTLVLAAANYAGHVWVTFRPDVHAPAAPLRVLQVSAFFAAHGGGIEVVADQIARRLALAGVGVHWIAGGDRAEWPRNGIPASLRTTGIRDWDPLERRIGLPMPLWGPRSAATLWRSVGDADIVHVHDYLYLPTLLAALFSKLRRRPLVVTQHIGEIPFRSVAARRLLGTLNSTLGAAVLRRADQVAFVSRPVLEYFGSLTKLRAPAALIPNGVDHVSFSPTPASRDQTAMVQLLFVGRFVEKKGTALLRQCLDLRGAHWTFVGWGPLPPADTPSDKVDLPGRLRAEQVAARYRRADLFVLPSTGEGFPLVIQEALACGTPVLVSREVAEAFPALDPRCVFDVELRGVPDPAAALRQAIVDLVASRERLREARVHAVALAAQWSWERCVESYRSVYDRVLAARRREVAAPRAR